MPVYKIRLSRTKAETLRAKLRGHYRSGKGLLPLAIQAANDYRPRLGPFLLGPNP